MTRILLVEDDEKIAHLLKRFLQSEGFTVDHCNNGSAAIEIIVGQQPDLVILDMMLPGADGLDVCEAVRPDYDRCILMLTAHEGDLNELSAFRAGVDDFVVKPVKPDILLARINVLLKRQQPKVPQMLEVCDLTIDHDKRVVHQSGEALNLSDSEFELLYELASKAGKIVSRENLFQRLRGKKFDGLDRSIDMRVSKLRKKLKENNPSLEYIRTLRQLGYLFVTASDQ